MLGSSWSSLRLSIPCKSNVPAIITVHFHSFQLHQHALCSLLTILFHRATFLYVALDVEAAMDVLGENTIIIHVVAAFLLLATNVGVTMGLYFITVGNKYVVRGSTAWWKMIRLEALIVGVLLLLVGVAFFVGGINLSVEGMPGWGQKFLNRLSLAIDVVQLATSLYSFGTILYVIRALHIENDILKQGMKKV